MNEIQRLNDFNQLAPALVTENPAMVDWLIKHGFFSAPASTKWHGAYNGGLYDHSKAVVDALEYLTSNLHLTWQRPESPFIVGMFHDLCKVDQYREVVDEPGKTMFGETEAKGRKVHYEWADPFVKGHGEKSVMYLSHLIQLTEEEMFCIRYHMGAFEKDDIEAYSKAIELFNNVLFAHTADMMASKIRGV